MLHIFDSRRKNATRELVHCHLSYVKKINSKLNMYNVIFCQVRKTQIIS